MHLQEELYKILTARIYLSLETCSKITHFLHLIIKAVIYLSPSIYVLNSAAEVQNFVNGRILNKPMCSSLLKQVLIGIIILPL